MKKTLLVAALLASFAAMAQVTEPVEIAQASAAETQPVTESKVQLLTPADVPTQPVVSQFVSNGSRAGDGIVVNHDNKGQLDSVTVVHTGFYNGDEYSSVLAAQMGAKARLTSFIKSDLQTKRSIDTITANIERSIDKTKTRAGSSAVGVSDAQVEGTEAQATATADPDNVAVRNFATASTRKVSENIVQNSAAILRGVMLTGSRIDSANKAVTVQITWTRKNLSAAKELGALMGNQ
jgi:hypothetical protein